MVSKQLFDELVANTTTYLQEHNLRLARVEKQLQELNERMAKMESRKKPGPKPRVEAA